MIQKAKAMLLCFIVLASTARADEAKTLILPTPYEAWSAATKDAEANAKASDGFRYVWVQSSDPMDVLAVEWITNMVYSRATTLLPVQVVHKSAQCGAVVRLDFRALAHNEEDFRNLLKLWEDFAGTEPYFLARVDKQKIQVTPYVAKDGKTYDYRYESVRLPSEHLPTTALPDLTGSFVPVVEYRWWQKKSISTADGNLEVSRKHSTNFYKNLQALAKKMSKISGQIKNMQSSSQESQGKRERSKFFAESVDGSV
jgi:hypothetical protein